MVSAYDAFLRLKKELSAASDTAEFELYELFSAFAGIPRESLLRQQGELSPETLERIESAVKQRCGGYPLQYLLGEWDFYGRTFRVGEGVLIPRADTETLVEAALAWADGRRGLRILDLCSGSGCIAITLANECPDSTVYALEKSPEALEYLRENAARSRVPLQILEEDALAPQVMPEELDLIVSNPPYLTGEDMRSLQPEVAYEPKIALSGGEDGLDFYRKLIPLWGKTLKIGGFFGFEIGIHQEEAVREIFLKNNCSDVCFHRDICGIIRVVSGRKAAV